MKFSLKKITFGSLTLLIILTVCYPLETKAQPFQDAPTDNNPLNSLNPLYNPNISPASNTNTTSYQFHRNGNNFDVNGTTVSRYINGDLANTTVYRTTPDSSGAFNAYTVNDNTGEVIRAQRIANGTTTNLPNAPSTFNQLEQVQQAKTDAAKQLPSNNDCGWICIAVTSGIMHTVGWFFGMIGELILRTFSLLLIIAATLFNLVIQTTVISMSVTVQNLQAINIGWVTFRDLANILFIFVLLYISIATILQLESVNTKKMLTNVVIVALLINFSLFFTKVIIDASNILSAQFYNAIAIKGQPLSHTDVTGAVATLGLSVAVNKTGADNGISDAIMSSMDLVTIFDFKKNPRTTAGTIGGVVGELVTISVSTVVGAIFICIAAIIFLVSGILFIIRFVILIFLLATSPLAYVGMILPATKQYSQKWWDALIKECIFAPVYFLMIWLTIKIMGTGGLKAVIPATGTWNDLLAGGIGSVSIVLNFMIVSALMVASLLISRNLGAKGGQAAFGAFDTIRRAGQGWVGRNTIGELGRMAEEKLQRTQWANNPFFDAIRGETTRRIAGAKFGSGSSRQEAYLHGQEIRSRRETAEKADDVREEVKKLEGLETEYKREEKTRKTDKIAVGMYTKRDAKAWEAYRIDWKKRWDKQKEEGQAAANRLTGSEFAQAFEKEEYMNGILMNLASSNQVEAVDTKREDMNDKEKDDMARKLFERPLINPLATYKKELEALRNRVTARAKQMGKSEEEAEAAADLAEAGLRDESEAFKNMHTYIRAMTEKELDLLHEVHPELFRDERFMPSVRFLKIQAMRHSGKYTPEEVDSVRFAKSFNLQRAEETGRAENIIQAIGDHAPSEIAGHKSKVRLDPRLVRYLGRNVVNEFLNQDVGDQEQVGRAIAWDLNRAMDNINNNKTGQISKQTADVWEWMHTDRYGVRFRTTAESKGVKFPKYDKKDFERLTSDERHDGEGKLQVVDKINEVDKRKKGDWKNWDKVMKKP